MKKLKPEDMPKHVAIIMDGNGRWATKKQLPRIEGHKKGAENVRTILERCIVYKIPYLTLYVFSTENWNRPQEEIAGLFKLLEMNLDTAINEAVARNIRLHHIGTLDKLPDHLKQKIEDAIKRTENNTLINLVLAFNYGSRGEIVSAVKRMIESGTRSGSVDETILSTNLFTSGIPDPDLIIRPGGEMRLSNFLLWQAAYAEIYFTQVLWPDFNEKEFDKALEAYSSRERRFGKLSE